MLLSRGEQAMKIKQEILKSLPSEIAEKLDGIENAEEIRLRNGKKVLVYANGEYITVPIRVTQRHIDLCIQKISKSSVYAFIEEIKNGFLTLDGGHRVGLCGSVIIKNGEILNIKNISGINFRIAHEIIGCSDSVMEHIISKDRVKNTLIISPPQCGKTTLIRDISRNIGSNHKVSIIDERGEITAMKNGEPQYDIGEMTDVTELCPKSVGIELMLRSMSPEVIITDEICDKDIDSVKKTLSCGVSVIATAHGDDVKETVKRLKMGDVINDFTIITLTKKDKKYGVDRVYKGEELIC